MENLVLEKYKHIHFVGVGGVSMYLLAIYCKDCGIEISGSDINENKYTKICKSKGIKVYIGHSRKNVNGCDLVVYSSAVDRSNVEIIEADIKGIKVVDRADFLACICRKFKYVIGVSGTHGKTTTCAMIYHILRESGEKVSCHIGADVEYARMNPEDEYLVLECCEYNRSFLRLYYNIAVVLNIDNDHLDCYGNMYNLKNAFKMFLKQAKTRFIFQDKSTSCIKNTANYIKPAEFLDEKTFMYNNKKFVLDNVYGRYNINNATVAIEVCEHLGLTYTQISKALKTFKSAGRRCQLLGKFKGIDVITDYAHHPNEIKSLHDSLKLKYDNIYIIFQPHTYSRTKILLHDFVKLFSEMKNVFIFKEYSARESKDKGYTAQQLTEYLDGVDYIKSYGIMKKIFVNMNLNVNKSCIVFVGAGDIDKVGQKFVDRLGD